MTRRYYGLPTLTSLAAFEAAARHMSFKDAAWELNVTPGAISRQIKALEEDLDTPLFVRIHRGVVLTPDGTALSETLADSFTRIAERVRQTRARRGSCHVTLGATTAVAAMWLMPRLGRFWRDHPEITVDHVISDGTGDSRAAPVDLRIRYGDGRWPEEATAQLFGDRLYPVCGPAFAAAHQPASLDELIALPVLRLEGVDPSWTDWSDWLRRLGAQGQPQHSRSFTSYVIALQAARDNQGVALGWHRLVAPDLRSGKLVRLGPWEVPAPGAFYVTWPARRALDAAAKALRDWLIAEAMRQDELNSSETERNDH